MSTVTFESVYHGDSPELGKLRFNAAGFGWKAYQSEENNPTTYSGTDVRGAVWQRGARLFQLRLNMRHSERPRVIFEGFKRDELDKLKRTLDDYFNVKLETRDISLKGWNWGKAQVQGNEIAFQVQGKPSFELPLSSVANSNIAGKNEVAIEFNPPAPFNFNEKDKDSSRRPVDELVEMRFYVPGKSMKARGSDAGSDDEESEHDEDGNAISAAEALHTTIKDKADIGALVGDTVVVFEDVLVLTPRGRYSLEFFNDSLRLLGKSTDYRIPFNHIHRIFLLPKPGDLHVQLVLGLDPPIRQGATRYPFLVAQWPKDEEVDAELNMSDDDLKKFNDLQKKYDGPTYRVISLVLKAMTDKKITPPSQNYRNAQGQPGVKANVKAVQGELYFLEKGIIFIAKQPILIDFSKTESISFSRVGGGIASAKTFDMRVVSKTDAADHVFSALPKEEMESIGQFLKSKNVRLKNELDDVMDIDPISDDDDDEDMSIPSEDEQKGKKGKSAGPAASKRDEEEDESEDEDFHEESSDGGSPSESDSDEESDAASDASDPMMEELKKKQAAKRAKNQGKDTASDEEAKPKKKKAKKNDDDD